MRRVTPADVVDVLDEVAEFLDNYVDVQDHVDGGVIWTRRGSSSGSCRTTVRHAAAGS